MIRNNGIKVMSYFIYDPIWVRPWEVKVINESR
jgi:hypothetical protein